MMTPRIVLGIVGAALSLQGAAGPPISACALLNDDEVAAVLGVRVNRGEPHDDGEVASSEYAAPGAYSSTCLWRVAGDGSPPSNPNLSLASASYAILNAMQWSGGRVQAESFLQSFRDAAKEGIIDQAPVPLKIADDALWWGDGVAARKGDRSFGISVHLAGAHDKERQMEEALAKKIASRL
jgi:hypothetical protein